MRESVQHLRDKDTYHTCIKEPFDTLIFSPGNTYGPMVIKQISVCIQIEEGIETLVNWTDYKKVDRE